jgi:hypothetical protein
MDAWGWGEWRRGEAGKKSTSIAAPMAAMVIAAQIKTVLNEL